MTMSMRKLFMITKLESVLLPLLWSSSFSPCKIDGQRSQSGAAPQKWSNIPKFLSKKVGAASSLSRISKSVKTINTVKTLSCEDKVNCTDTLHMHMAFLHIAYGLFPVCWLLQICKCLMQNNNCQLPITTD